MVSKKRKRTSIHRQCCRPLFACNWTSFEFINNKWKKKHTTRPTFQTLLLCGECAALTKRRKLKRFFFVCIHIKWIFFFHLHQVLLLSPFRTCLCVHISLCLCLTLYSIRYAVNGRLTENNTTKEDSIYIKWNYVDAVFETCFDRSQQHSTPSSNRKKKQLHFISMLFFQAEFRNKREKKCDCLVFEKCIQLFLFFFYLVMTCWWNVVEHLN